MKPNINKGLFWDVDFDKLDYLINARFVIERVLTRGDLEDFKEIMRHYGKDNIRNEITKIRYLDKLTLNFCKIYFDLKEEELICCNTEPSIRELWNY